MLRVLRPLVHGTKEGELAKRRAACWERKQRLRLGSAATSFAVFASISRNNLQSQP
jgi:hypothetical protein